MINYFFLIGRTSTRVHQGSTHMRQRMLSNRNITYTGTYIPNTYIAEITDLTGRYFDMVSRMTLDLLKIFFFYTLYFLIVLFSSSAKQIRETECAGLRRPIIKSFIVASPIARLEAQQCSGFRVHSLFVSFDVFLISFVVFFCFHFLSRLFNVPFSFHIFCFYSCFLIYHFFLIFLYSKYFSNTQ